MRLWENNTPCHLACKPGFCDTGRPCVTDESKAAPSWHSTAQHSTRLHASCQASTCMECAAPVRGWLLVRRLSVGRAPCRARRPQAPPPPTATQHVTSQTGALLALHAPVCWLTRCGATSCGMAQVKDEGWETQLGNLPADSGPPLTTSKDWSPRLYASQAILVEA